MTDQHNPAARSNDAPQAAAPADDADCWDYVDGTLSEPNPSSNWKSMFDSVREKIGITNQGSEDYQEAVTNVINNAMQAAVRTATPVATQLAQPAPGSVPEAWAIDDTTGKMRPFPAIIDPMDPSNYQSSTARQIAPGVLEVTRLPNSPSPSMRPITVRITAQQVVDEYDAVLKKHASSAAARRAHVDDLSKRQQDMATGFLFN